MIGEKIKNIRRDYSLTQKELSHICDVSQVQIARYESNKATPSKRVLSKISKGMNIPIEYFFEAKANASDSLLETEFKKLMEVLPSNEKNSLLSIFRAYYISSIQESKRKKELKV